MDIKEGEVVSGNQGDRESYRPIKSGLVDSSNPRKVLHAFEENYMFDAVYIADIDSLQGKGNNFETVKQLSEGFNKDIILDCGYTDYEGFDGEVISHVDKFIVPTESLKSLEELERLMEEHPESEFIVSIDLDETGFISEIGEKDVYSFLNEINDVGIDEVILLDISQVGTEKGPSEQVMEITEEVKEDFIIISGGGVSDEIHYQEFVNAGVEGVLVATALHECKLDSLRKK